MQSEDITCGKMSLSMEKESAVLSSSAPSIGRTWRACVPVASTDLMVTVQAWREVLGMKQVNCGSSKTWPWTDGSDWANEQLAITKASWRPKPFSSSRADQLSLSEHELFFPVVIYSWLLSLCTLETIGKTVFDHKYRKRRPFFCPYDTSRPQKSITLNCYYKQSTYAVMWCFSIIISLHISLYMQHTSVKKSVWSFYQSNKLENA